MTLQAEIKVKSDPTYVAKVRQQVEMFASNIGFSKDDTNQIGLAVNEAIANIIKHGYKGDTTQDIYLKLEQLRNPKDGIRITIQDNAQHVDPECIKGRNLNEIRPGGLGVHIIKSVMDYVKYNQRPQYGMELIMVKYK